MATAQPDAATSTDAPEQGQLVQVRHRLFLVEDIVPHDKGDGELITRVDLECLDDDRLGETLSVLWEREVGARVLGGDAFPSPSGKWDHPRVYEAFLKAVRWSSSSVLHGADLQSRERSGQRPAWAPQAPARLLAGSRLTFGLHRRDPRWVHRGCPPASETA